MEWNSNNWQGKKRQQVEGAESGTAIALIALAILSISIVIIENI